MALSTFLLNLGSIAGILILLSFCSCKQSSHPLPPVPLEKMEKILLDLQLAETYSLGLGDSVKNRFTKNKDSLAVFYQAIFDHYGITADSFVMAMNWYENHPDLTDSMFGRTLDRLNKEKARLNISSGNTEGQEAPRPATATLNKDTVTNFESLRDTVTQLLQPRTKPGVKTLKNDKE